MRSLVVSIILFAHACGGAASAQTIAVRTLALRPGEMPEVFVKGTEEYHAVEFSDRQPGEVARALRTNPLPLYRRGVDAEGKEAFVVSHKVAVPAGAKGILLLGWTDGKDARYVGIEDDFGAARFNDWLLINAAERPVAFLVGEKGKPVVVGPAGSKRCRIAGEKGKGAPVQARASFDGETKTFFSTYWPVHANKRTVVLFVDDGAGIQVKRISDQLAPAEP